MIKKDEMKNSNKQTFKLYIKQYILLFKVQKKYRQQKSESCKD